MTDPQRKLLESLQAMMGAIAEGKLNLRDIEEAVKQLPHLPAIATATTMVTLGVLTAHAAKPS